MCHDRSVGLGILKVRNTCEEWIGRERERESEVEIEYERGRKSEGQIESESEKKRETYSERGRYRKRKSVRGVSMRNINIDRVGE